VKIGFAVDMMIFIFAQILMVKILKCIISLNSFKSTETMNANLMKKKVPGSAPDSTMKIMENSLALAKVITGNA